MQVHKETLSTVFEFTWEVVGTPAGEWWAGRAGIEGALPSPPSLRVPRAEPRWNGLWLRAELGSPALSLATCPANRTPTAGGSPQAKRCASSSSVGQRKEHV